MNSGLWVLCEKPLATTMADAWRVVEAESALGSRRMQLGFMRVSVAEIARKQRKFRLECK